MLSRNLLLLFTLFCLSANAIAETITHSFLATGRETYIIEFKPGDSTKGETEEPKSVRPDIVFEDFEKPTYEGWTATGTSFGDGPIQVAKMPEYQGNVGAHGNGVVNAHNTRGAEDVLKGDAHTGTLTSNPFTITRNHITFLVGGGPHKGKTCINLLVDGKVVQSVTGRGANAMHQANFDVRALAGKEAQIQVVDNWTKGWGNISIDHIVFADLPSSGEPKDTSGGKIVWRYKSASRDGWVLDNGNVLLALPNAAVEVTREGKEVWSYKGTQKEVQAIQPLDNGNILIVEGGAKPRLMELTRDGEIAVEIALQCQTKNAHMETRMARKLENGNYLCPHLLDYAVKEYDPTGKVVRVIPTDYQGRDAKAWPFTAIRLPNGNTLVGCTYSNQVLEFDKDNKIVWKVSNDDLPGNPIKDACGVQRLPNGNTVITSYGGRGAGAIKLIEVTPDKKIVWTHKSGKNHGIHHFQILDTNGVPLDGKPLK